ncbi:hypothetical protein LCI18_013713 [Fusarium solani-melongenae]|uniref:Uncharacterized protein n=1 Tax=Fusarium solani subsp. cucurbitae TaxID=2747967 RepID=A0ACD3ZNX7_FUSSC|nr:hypothetical protein LCI18_013713 [Fusarium solani-melongenae]
MKRTGDGASPADDELKQRRERGRNAQRAFRQRQITTINELRDRNHAMQSAIASLARVASRIEDSELDDAIRNAWQAAGLDGPERGDVYGDNQPTDERSVAQPGGAMLQENLGISGKAQSPQLTPIEPSPSSPSRGLGHHPTVLPRPYGGHSTQHQDSAANELQHSYQTGQMSPRLGYGLWLERPVIRLSNPPVDIIPYLSTNVTLSSVVFWSGLLWGFKVLQAALGGNDAAAATAHRVFGEIVPMKPDRSVLDGIHARLTFRNLGYVPSDHPGYDPEGGTRMQSIMARTCEANGTPIETFLRPDRLEGLLRERLGEGYQVIEQALQGFGSSANLSRAQRLIDRMIRSSVCLGDGPRWRLDWMVTLLDSWANE